MAKANQKIKHGDTVYNEGEDIPDELADYFASNGWLVGSEKIEAPTPQVEDKSVDIVAENPYVEVGPIRGQDTDPKEFDKAVKVIAEQEAPVKAPKDDVTLEVQNGTLSSKSTDISAKDKS